MTPRWERIAAPTPQAPVLMDAVLAPNRSLSRQARRLLIVAFATANAVPAIFFIAQGAFPVSGFMGLDVLALVWAMHVSERSGKARERVQVSPAAVQVTRRAPDNQESHYAVSPLWARVQEDSRAVRIRAGASDVYVAGFLAPFERAAFAEALKEALAQARSQRPSTSRIE
ncbi:MAG: DUF2244 domain-containing protein [Alphaproteobacteria bacterium]